MGLCAAAALAFTALPGFAQVSITSESQTYTQTFNSLPSRNHLPVDWINNQTLVGWSVTAGNSGPAQSLAAEWSGTEPSPWLPGASATPGEQGYYLKTLQILHTGTLADDNRQWDNNNRLGARTGGGPGNVYFTLHLQNDSGAALSGFYVGYEAAQFFAREGGAIWVEYSFDNTVWTRIQPLTYNAPFVSPGVNKELNVEEINASRTPLSAAVEGVNWGAGNSLYIRWALLRDIPGGTIGNSPVLSIDQVTFLPLGDDPVLPEIALTAEEPIYFEDFQNLILAKNHAPQLWENNLTVQGWAVTTHNAGAATRYGSVWSGTSGTGWLGGASTDPTNQGYFFKNLQIVTSGTHDTTTGEDTRVWDGVNRIGARSGAAPGNVYMTLTARNRTGGTITALDVSYEAAQFLARGTTLMEVQYSFNNVDWVTVDDLRYDANSGAINSQFVNKTLTLAEIEASIRTLSTSVENLRWADGDLMFVRWVIWRDIAGAPEASSPVVAINDVALAATFTAGPAVPPNVAILRGQAGAMVLSVVGDANASYALEYSSDLVTWHPLSTVQTDGEGVGSYEDAAAAGETRRFYRAH
jgi:hypothetical protein